MHRRLPVALSPAAVGAAVLVAVLGLSGCSSSGGGDRIASGPTAPTGAVPTAPTGPPATTGVAPASAPITVGTTLTDARTGTRITVRKYVLGYQPSAAARARYSSLIDETVLLVDVTIAAGSGSSVSVGASDFRLHSVEAGTDEPIATLLGSELAVAGYPQVKDATPGSSRTGWVAFTPRKDLTDFTLRYTRPAYKRGGTTVPAKTYEAALGTS